MLDGCLGWSQPRVRGSFKHTDSFGESIVLLFEEQRSMRSDLFGHVSDKELC